MRAPSADELAARPVERVSALVELVGPDAVVDWCVALLRGGDWTDVGAPDLDWIGGRSSASMVGRALALDHWPRVWAARALLHVYRPQAASAVVAGLSDQAWRVREMCAKVAGCTSWARPRGPCTGAALTTSRGCAPPLCGRWLVVGEAEDADAMRDCLDDPERDVAVAAERALREMSRRLDRPL